MTAADIPSLLIAASAGDIAAWAALRDLGEERGDRFDWRPAFERWREEWTGRHGPLWSEHDNTGGYLTWFNRGYYEDNSGGIYIPEPVFRHLQSDLCYAGMGRQSRAVENTDKWRDYLTADAALDDLFQAWGSAVADGWNPWEDA